MFIITRKRNLIMRKFSKKILYTFHSIFSVAILLSSKSLSMESAYSLSHEVDPSILTQSSVIIMCPNGNGSGFALGEKHILTAAHTVVGYNLFKSPIECVALKVPKKNI